MSIFAEYKHSKRNIEELEEKIRVTRCLLKALEEELQANKDLYADSVCAMMEEARRDRDDWRYLEV